MRWISVVAILTLFCALSSEVLAGAVDRANVSIVVTVAEADDAVNAARISACKQARNANRPVCRALSAQGGSSSRVISSNSASGNTATGSSGVATGDFVTTLQSLATLDPSSDAVNSSQSGILSGTLRTLLALSSTEQTQFASSQIQSDESDGEVRFTVASI